MCNNPNKCDAINTGASTGDADFCSLLDTSGKVWSGRGSDAQNYLTCDKYKTRAAWANDNSTCSSVCYGNRAPLGKKPLPLPLLGRTRVCINDKDRISDCNESASSLRHVKKIEPTWELEPVWLNFYIYLK